MQDISCEICGMNFVKNSPKNNRDHRKRHDGVVNGFKWNKSAKETIIYQRSDFRIVVVNSQSTKFLRTRASKVSSLANRDTHFDCGVYSQTDDALLGILGNRAVSLILLYKMNVYWRGSWEEFPPRQENINPNFAQLGMGFLWVIKKLRGTKILKEMPQAACDFTGLCLRELPLQGPFRDGFENFWRKYSPDGLTIGRPC